MPVRGLALSIDGFMALAIAACVVTAVVVSPTPLDDSFYHRSSLARDYLVIKYTINASVTPLDFFNLAFANVTEVQPSGGEWLGAQKIVHAGIAGCANASNCIFSSGSPQASHLTRIDSNEGARSAWVKVS